MNAINNQLKSPTEKQVPHKVLGFYGWCQVCRSHESFMLCIEGAEFLLTVTGELGDWRLWWCSSSAPAPRQARMSTSIFSKCQERVALWCLSALAQKELNSDSWSTTLLEFKDKGIVEGFHFPNVLLCSWPEGTLRALTDQLSGRLCITGFTIFHLSSLSFFFFKGNLCFAKLIFSEQTSINPVVNDGLYHVLFCMGQDCYSQ